MTSLITGISGFVGSHLAKHLVEKGETVVGLIHNHHPPEWLCHDLKGCHLIRGDLNELRLVKRIIAHFEVNMVYHFGALANVKTAFKEPVSVYRTNMLGTVNVLEACRISGVKVLALITDKIFGEKLKALHDTRVAASDPYGTSKACADLICESYGVTYNLPVVRMRCCNIYGLDVNSNRIIPNTIKKCLRGEQPVIFEGENKTLRQYIFIEDVMSAIETLSMKERCGAFNVCTETVLNQEDVVTEILRHFPGVEPERVLRQAPPEIQRQSMSLTPFNGVNESKWVPRFSFDVGIKKTVAQFEEYYAHTLKTLSGRAQRKVVQELVT